MGFVTSLGTLDPQDFGLCKYQQPEPAAGGANFHICGSGVGSIRHSHTDYVVTLW